jgi:hypothetical protein
MAGYNAYRLTSFETIESVAAPFLLKLGFSSSLDNFYPQVVELARQNPDAVLELPLPLELGIKGEEILNLSEQETKELFVSRMLRTVYTNPESLELSKGEMRDSDSVTLMLRIFSRETHENIRVLTLFLLAVTLVLMFPFLYLSPRFSKLSGLGGSLLAVSLPGFASLYAARLSLARILAQNEAAMESVTDSLRSLILQVQISYAVVLGTGLLLLFAGWACSLFVRERK